MQVQFHRVGCKIAVISSFIDEVNCYHLSRVRKVNGSEPFGRYEEEQHRDIREESSKKHGALFVAIIALNDCLTMRALGCIILVMQSNEMLWRLLGQALMDYITGYNKKAHCD